MKLFALLLAAAGLSGCVAYPYGGSGYYGQGYYQGSPYVVEPQSSLYIYGGGYRADRASHYRRRDHDRDGIPDRVDRDRDGDGVPNRADRRPYDPRRN